MPASTPANSLRNLIFICSISLLFHYGLGKDPSGAKNENKDNSHGASRSSVGLKIIIICLSLATVIALCVLLFKLWQKKKRAEQHSRLLKLFEEDDELEVELGMRD